MTRKILLTSFDTWLPHHKSNSSDDLLEKISQLHFPGESLTLLRKLPVDFQLAPNRVVAQINALKPDAIICCGMAESREKLTVESRAKNGYEVIKAAADIEGLVENLAATEISHEAGKFVCEGLYYSVLKHLRDRQLPSRCVFVHVPRLDGKNSQQLQADFLSILQRMKRL